MKLLLDTHVLLWWLDDPLMIEPGARELIQDERNEVLVSVAVVWEIVIKKAIGKLDAPDDVEDAIAVNRFLPLPIGLPHVLAVRSLGLHHRDPFDRILIAQALVEGGHLVTRDPNIGLYPVPVIGA